MFNLRHIATMCLRLNILLKFIHCHRLNNSMTTMFFFFLTLIMHGSFSLFNIMLIIITILCLLFIKLGQNPLKRNIVHIRGCERILLCICVRGLHGLVFSGPACVVAISDRLIPK